MTRKEDYDEVSITNSIIYGEQADGPVVETNNPGSFSFLAGEGRDIYDQTVATLSNEASSSATETVKLQVREYNDDGTTGSQILFQRKSVTIAAGGSTTVTYTPSSRFALPQDEYQVNLIFETDSSFTPTETEVTTTGGKYDFSETDGALVLTDHDNEERGRYGAVDGAYTTSFSKSKKSSVVEPVIRVYPPTTNETTSTVGPSYEDRLISEYADITDAINQALVDYGSGTGVRLPPGTFEASTPVQQMGGRWVGGAPRKQTTIDWTGTGTAFFFEEYAHNGGLRNIQFQNSGDAGHAIVFSNAFQNTIRDCNFYGWTNTPVKHDGSSSGCHMIKVDNCFFKGGSSTHLDWGKYGLGSTIIGCSFRDIPKDEYGLRAGGGGMAIINCELLSKGFGAAGAINIVQANGWTVMGCNFENLSEDIDGDGTKEPVGWGIVLGRVKDNGDKQFWNSGSVIGCNYGGVAGGLKGLLRVELLAINDGAVVDINNCQAFGDSNPDDVDMGDIGQGYVHINDYREAKIINDSNNRALGRDKAGEHIIRSADGSTKHRATDRIITETSANHTAIDNEAVFADASGGAITVTLPTPSTGDVVSVKKVDSSTNAVTIATPNTETIDGASSTSLSSQYESTTITSNGTNYFVLD